MRQKGFTLIELLVVISIFGLISSVALANLQNARQRTEEAAGKQFHATVQRSLGDRIIAGWEFNEGSGTEALDSTGSGLNGTIFGATYVVGGVSGDALNFDGQDYIIGQGFPDIGNDAAFTVAAWVKPENVAKANTIFYLGDDGAGGGTCTGVEVAIQGGKGYTKSDSGEGEITGRDIVNNVWQNVVFVYSNGYVETYINGVKINSAPGATTECGTGSWSIGASVTTNGPAIDKGYVGLLDSVYVYDSALSAIEIQNKYAEDLRNKKFLANL